MSIEKILERVPPHNAEAEAAVLGSMMIDSRATAIAIEELDAQDFYVGRHATLFTELKKLFNRVENLDEVIVRNELKKAGKLDDVGGPDALARLVNDTGSAASVESYCKIVREFAIQRELISAAGRILMCTQDPEGRDTHELVDHAEKLVYDISDNRTHNDAASMTDILSVIGQQAEAAYLARQEGKEIESPALPTRYDDLDRLMSGGLWPGELIILAGRPSMGKTTFAINIARNVACPMVPDFERRRRPVAIFSLEMPKEQVAKNIVCAQAQVSGYKMRNYSFSEDEYNEVVAASRVLQTAPIHIDDTSGITVEQLRARCRRLKHRHHIGLVVVDYLQLMSPSAGSKRGNRQEEVSEISRGLKGIARELNVPMIVLSQLNRSMEKRDNDDKRPALSDLRDSGAIEQDADVVIMLYREEYYDIEKNKENINHGEALVQKNRNGGVGSAKLTFIKDQLRFESYFPDQPSGGT
ncbi:MAG TPA: replicative DNA helicase [Planctomycetota bacterium]|nr:replicative DNA helicase [Planctomycetota bacterium]